jgi:hypothetical protein
MIEFRRTLRQLGAAAAVVLPLACVSTAPIAYTPPGGDDAGTTGSSNDASDAAATGDGDGGNLVDACRTCLTTGPCQDLTNACEQNQHCGVLLDCLVDAYCLIYGLNVDLAHIPKCLQTCGVMAQITGPTDPAAALFTPVAMCAQDPGRCANVCDVTDAGP